MGQGPITIFDKSALQMFSVDESVWFDHFYFTNVTPLFYVETLADLEKKVADGRTPEQVVRQLATKSPANGMPNVHHERVALTNLMGEEIPFRGAPVVAHGRHVRSGDRKGVVYRELPEWQAFHRWQRGQYLEVEREFAKSWRSSLQSLNLREVYSEYRPVVVDEGVPKTLAAAKVVAERVLFRTDRGDVPLVLTFDYCNVQEQFRPAIRKRWKASGKPAINIFAPYAAHVALVELFFCIAIAADLIGRERPSNHADIAYLHYLPFCMVFVSNDKLHGRTVPVFLREDQMFVRGADLKADLSRLDAHYMKLSDSERSEGIWRFASRPPTDGDFLVSALWDKYQPSWRRSERGEKRDPAVEKKKVDELMEEIRGVAETPASSTPVGLDEADFVLVERYLPVRRGKWRIYPPGAENTAKKTT